MSADNLEKIAGESRPGKYLVGAAVLIALAAPAYLAGSHDRFPGDLAVSTWVQSFQTGWLNTAIKTISFAGVPYVAGPLALMATLAFFLAGRREAGVLIVTTVIVGYGVRTVMKLIVARPRPPDGLVQIIEEADGFSFPSGHVMFYVVLLGALNVALSGAAMSDRARRSIRIASAAAVLLIGLSRIYLGAHWLSDVLAGYLFGAAVVAAAALAWRRWVDTSGP